MRATACCSNPSPVARGCTLTLTHTQTPTRSQPPQALLYNARDGLLQRSIAGGKSRDEVAAIAKAGPVEDTLENRRLGWQRMCLLVLYFQPSGAWVAG